MLRKLFFLMLLFGCLMLVTAAEAAQVTGVKWGVDYYNVLRIVVDATDSASYAVTLEENALKLTVNAAAGSGVAKSSKIKSPLADTMQVTSAGGNTVVSLPLKQRLTSGDYKAFTLKKDPVTNRPFRVVLDVTAAKTAAPSVTVAKPAAASSGAPAASVVSNKPVVSSTPSRAGSTAAAVVPKETTQPTVRTDSKKTDKTVAAAAPRETSQPTVRTDSKKEADKDKDNKKKDDKKQEQTVKKSTSRSKNKGAAEIKGSGKFRTSGGLKDKIITLDAGHGGSDPGAIGAKGTKEKTITLAIAMRVQYMLTYKGAKVYMTRTKDVDVYGPNASDKDELQARVNVAEKYNSDLFLSLHINASVNKNVGGFSTYYYPKTSHDLRIAQAVQKKLTDNFGVDDLGVRQANFYVIKRCSMPAALLELCFISNPKEETLMKGNWFQKKAATMIVEGIEKYFG